MSKMRDVHVYIPPLEHSYAEYCNLIGQGVVYKSHINHETWLISARARTLQLRALGFINTVYPWTRRIIRLEWALIIE